MAGFTSLDNLITNVSNSGKFWRTDWNKNSATAGTVVAGTWQCFAPGAGNPPANTTHVAAVTKTWHPSYDFTSGNNGILHNGNVAAAWDGYKVILNASVFSGAATSAPIVFMLVDVLAYSQLTAATLATAGTYTFLNTENVTFDSSSGLRMITTNDYDTYTPFSLSGAGTPPTGMSAGTIYWTIRQDATHSKIATSLQNAIANTYIAWTDNGTPVNTLTCRWPRYSTGAGVDILAYNLVAFGTAGTSNHTINYTNSAGTGSRQTPATLPASPTSVPIFTIPYSGTAAGRYGPGFPRQSTDAGVQSIQSYVTSGNLANGALAVLAYKPLLTLPITTIGVASERDLVNQLPSMPRVYDGACLMWLVYTQVAIPNNTAYYGHLDFGWS
jgi:hypothetical protein